MPLLVLAFLLIPLLEIYLLIEIGGLIGAYWTVAAVVGTALAGAALVRRQGLATIHRFRVAMGQGELPALTIMEGLVLLVAGALLLTPGFFTDAFGFLLLFPPFRNLITKMIRSKLKSADMKFSPHETGPDNTVIDAEYTDISEQNPSSGPTKH